MLIATALALALSAAPDPVAAGGEPAPMQCDVGPVRKTFGGTPWLVYGCADGRTVVVVSDAGSPASPFYFVFAPTEAAYRLVGEGNGDKTATAAAFEDLKALSPDEIAALAEEALKAAGSARR